MNSLLGKSSAFALFIAVFTYLVLRALYVPLCSDEAATFLTFINDGKFVPYVNQLVWSANNHLLNSALAWFSLKAFGLSEFSLRLPTVLSFVLYAWFAYKLSGLLKHSVLQWILYLLLLLGSHYMLEFFAYTRGYGLGLCFLLGAIFYLIQFLKSNASFAFLWLGLLCMVLATLANLGLLITFGIWLIFALIALLISKIEAKQKILFVLVSLVPLVFLGMYGVQLKSNGELYFGQGSLFATSWSLFSNLMHQTNYDELFVFNAIVLLTILLAVVLIVKKGFFRLTPLHLLTALFVGNVVAAIAMNALLEVVFPSERTAIHWLFLWFVFVPFALDELSGVANKVGKIAGCGLLILLLGFSFSKVNLKVSGEGFWAKEQIPESFYNEIVEQDLKAGFRHSISSPNIFYGYVLSFQDFKHQESSIDLCHSFENNPVFLADLSIVDVKEFPEMLDKYEPLLFDKNSKMTLLKRKQILARNFLADSTVSNENLSDEFVGLFQQMNIDLIQQDVSKGFRLEVDVEALSESAIFNGVFTLSMADSDGNQVFYKQVNAFLFPSNKKHERHMEFSYTLNDVPKNAQSLNVYLWNNYHQKLKTVTSKVALYQLCEPTEISIFEK